MAKNTKVKDLNLSNLKKEVKKLDAQREVTIFIEEEAYKFKVDEKFRRTKQHKVLDDLIKFFNEGVIESHLMDLATPYISLLLIKHFTSVEVSDEVSEAIEMLNVLTDLEILEPILNELPEEEVEKIHELLVKTLENLKNNIDFAEGEELVLLDEVENEVVKEVLIDGEKQ
ncbi:hypothetical protein PQE75_gp223 [Bacillus phage vB_BcoS-136]|uniref:Uncharacterized protein n=1 Tax=Bacillus phage vB_BcoS-136 TaxID=2419619 RepID=A0A3G3BVZ9_9CAUD|nr:hypothetical protein PQE75_gp223 [Bacillus phage vB_BcoS-136]AYP68256.1 hypothetical protein vBBcoS136_00141 [Bacillus phage vB_BcoS-136]